MLSKLNNRLVNMINAVHNEFLQNFDHFQTQISNLACQNKNFLWVPITIILAIVYDCFIFGLGKSTLFWSTSL